MTAARRPGPSAQPAPSAQPVPTVAAELVLDVRAFLGEGPLWDAAGGLVWWVDILDGLVHAYDPISGSDRTLAIGEAVGAVGMRAGAGLVVAAASRLAALDPATGRLETLVEFEPEASPCRMNDGKPDPTGAFWVGRMDLDEAPGRGSLLRIDPDHSVTTMLAGLTSPNGMAWDLEARRMYFIDSASHAIDVHEFDAASRTIGPGRRLVTFPGPAGVPDGLTLDSEGCVWVAMWGGGCVLRVSPDGDVHGRVEVPGVSRVSSCTFGGRDLADLYITSAREGMSSEDALEEPTAGGLFRARPGVTGITPGRYLG